MEITAFTFYFYLRKFLSDYFYFYLSKTIPTYLYFYLSTRFDNVAQHCNVMRNNSKSIMTLIDVVYWVVRYRWQL